MQPFITTIAERQKHALGLVMVAESAKWKKTLAKIRISFDGPTVYLTWQCDLRRSTTSSIGARLWLVAPGQEAATPTH